MSEALSDTVSLSVENGIAVVLIDNPPVNALGLSVRQGLAAAADRIASDSDIKAAVLSAKGRTFPAGADIAEFDIGMREPWLPGMCKGL